MHATAVGPEAFVRIAYVCYWDAFATDGVTAKIAGQTRVWRSMGHEVDVFCLSPAPARWREPVLDAHVVAFRSMWGRPGATRRLESAVLRAAPDVAYLRYDLFLPPLAQMLRRVPTVLEVNTDDRREYSLRRRRARAYNVLNRRVLFGGVRGLVCVTNELAERNADARLPTATITNGVILPPDPPATAQPGERPQLAFLTGARAVWHGLDKLVALARAVPEWDVVIIGANADEIGEDLPPNARALGILDRSAYAAVLASSDIALGTMALHRAGLEEATPLKVREYLAHGVPTVIAHRDTDFLGQDPWFLLRLPNVEDNLRDGVPSLRAFLEAVRGRRVQRSEIAALIGLEAKEAARLEFVARATGGQGIARRDPRDTATRAP